MNDNGTSLAIKTPRPITVDGETFEAMRGDLIVWFHDAGRGLSSAESRVAAREVLELLEIATESE